MRNILNGIETLTVTRKPYNPMPNMFMEFLPTLWINECTGESFIATGRDGCITNIRPLKDFDGIEEILTQCGIVKPNENKQVDVEGSCGIRAVSDDCPDFCINLLTGYGLKGGGQICKGETRTIELDAEITGDVKGPDSAKVGDVPVFKDETGKSITTSNINSVDGLTKITKSSKGEQKLLIETEDTESGSDAGVEVKSTGSGTPYFQLTQGDQKWRTIINPETGAREIRPVDDLSKDSIMNFLPNGIVTGNLQPKASARLTQSTPVFERNKWIQVGSNLAFQKLRDEDGYNKSANNFFPGNGAGNGAYYTVPYTGVWAVQFQFLIDQSINKTGTRILYRLTWGNEGSYQSLRNAYQLAFKYQPLSDCRLLPLKKGNICFLEVRVDDNDESVKPFIYAEADVRSIDSYIGFFLVYG